MYAIEHDKERGQWILTIKASGFRLGWFPVQEWAMFFRDAGNAKIHEQYSKETPFPPAEAVTDDE